MPTPFYFRSFEKGVISHLPATKLTDVASTRALNSAFRSLEGGTLTVGRRPGYLETVVLPFGRTIYGQAWFHYTEDGVTTVHHILVADNGTLWAAVSGTAVPLTIPTGSGEFVSASVGDPSQGVRFAQLNNVLLGFMFEGTHFKIWRAPADSTLRVGTIGLPKPPPPTLNSAIGGSLSGTIDFEVTYYNARTDTESNPSDIFTYEASSNTIILNLPTAAPSEVDKIRVYIRKQELQTKFRRNAAMQVPIGTATISLNFTDPQLNQMTISAPTSATVYDQPPAHIRDATIHLSRCFITDGARIYYSKAGNGEQYASEAVELVNPEDGQLIMNLLTVSDETLGIWKERSVHGMSGQTPASWGFDQLIPALGSISSDSLVEGDGQIGWWSEDGPVAWSKSGPPNVLTDATIRPLVKSGIVYLNRRNHCKAGFDPIGHRFLFTLDRSSPSTNPWSVVPWSTAQQVWEASAWDLGTIQSLALGHSVTNEMRLFFSGPSEVVYEMSARYLRDNALEGSGAAYRSVVSATTAALELDLGTPSVNPRGSIARVIRRATLDVHRSPYTLSGTTLTWTTPSTWVPMVGDLVVFDTGIVEWDTVKSTAGAFENEKRFLQTYCDVWTDGDTPIMVGCALDNEQTRSKAWSTTIKRNNTDQPVAGPSLTGPVNSHKRWLGRRARWMRMTFLGWYPLTDWHLSMLGYTAAAQGDEE